MSALPHVVSVTSRFEKHYTVKLNDCEPRNWPHSETWRYVPRTLLVTRRDGNLTNVELYGPRLKKDGSEQNSQCARERFWSGREMPRWVKSIVDGLA